MVKQLGIRPSSLPESVSSAGSNMEAGEDEEFYEMIEAPKFVDFTSPDHFRPDDHYWFCLRVGCKQKHEEEMDSEKIYKDFVLRVMAARSPNIRLQKALSRNASRNLKCPMSVPSKFSKPKLLRSPIISSVSRKLGFEKDEVKPPTKLVSAPKVKTKQVAAKYLTTLSSKTCLPDGNSLNTAVAASKNRVAVKKARHSPMKAISLKKSVELRTPLTKLCEGVKRLEITSQKKHLLWHSKRSLNDPRHNPGKSMPLDATNKIKTSKKDAPSQPQAAKKVKRVKSVKGNKESNLIAPFESELSSVNIVAESPQIEATPSDDPGEKMTLSNLEPSDDPGEKMTLSNLEQIDSKSMPLDTTNKIKISKKDVKSVKDALSQPQAAKKVKRVKSVKGNKESNLIALVESEPSSVNIVAESPQIEATPSDDPREKIALSHLEQIDSKRNDPPSRLIHETKEDSSTGGSEQEGTNENSDNVDSIKSDHTEIQLSEVQYQETQSTEGDDKENDASADENRTLNDNNIQSKDLGEQMNTIKKIAQPVDKNHKALTTANAPSGLKFKKPKPTNPKPFRLRTDERSILKESNIERKVHHPPDHLPNGNLPRKHGADSQDNVETQKQRNKGSAKESADSDCNLIKGNNTTAERTTTNMSRGKVVRSKVFDVASKTPNNASTLKKVEPPLDKKQIMSQRLSSTKHATASNTMQLDRKLATIGESSSIGTKPTKAREVNDNGAMAIQQNATSALFRSSSQGRRQVTIQQNATSALFRSSSQGRRQVTIPKEPHFHTSHVPKSCTRKLK